MDFDFWQKEWAHDFDEREARVKERSAVPELSYWDARAQDFSAMRTSNDYSFGRSVAAVFRDVLTPAARVLDIGAGPGSFVIPFAREAAWVTAVEPSDGMAEILAENARREGLTNYDIVRALLQEIPQGQLEGRYDLALVSLVLWMFRDVWTQIERMESYTKRFCAIVAGVPDKAHPRPAHKADFAEFQTLYNMLLSRGRFPNVSVIGYRCERSVEEEIRCRMIMARQYDAEVTAETEAQIRRDAEARAQDGMCLISSRAAVIWWDKGDTVPVS
ncbi:class I SAM-dependent methyltransferase [uncultured Selenomonas sp.]|uniref:class I SAM-dependent methyltransferase n=1 Tax=uncultured Selenomonas sp. TaxID=159275 RepID=UPI0028E467FF|nr:class I SAM-dependent methyltransferase [uncultured Selenomonas sp.]